MEPSVAFPVPDPVRHLYENRNVGDLAVGTIEFATQSCYFSGTFLLVSFSFLLLVILKLFNFLWEFFIEERIAIMDILLESAPIEERRFFEILECELDNINKFYIREFWGRSIPSQYVCIQGSPS